MNEIPIIITTSNYKTANEPDQLFQCDCACADQAFAFTTPTPDLSAPLRHPFLHTQALPNGHTLMFNPHRDNGVAVVNAPAKAIWQTFATGPDPVRPMQNVVDKAQPDHYASTITKLVEAGLLEPANTQVQVRQFAAQTLSAWVHVTNECNLRCDYCYIRKTEDDMSEDIGRAAVDAIFRSARKHNFKQVKLKFAGGEATMNLKRVFDIHAYASEQANKIGLSVDTVILSNGVSIGERAIAQFIERGIRVSISLDGVDEYHDAQRKFANGQGSFRWVSRTIDKLIAKGIKPFISITLSDRNADGLAQTIKYVIDRDLPFNINFFRDNDCAAPHSDLKLRDDRVIDAMLQAFSVIEAQLPTRSLLGSLVDRAQFDQPHDKTCSVGDAYLVIDHQGQISKCQMEIERPVTSIFADDPLAFIHSDKIGIQNLRVEEKEGCRECEWKYWCAGGCPALTFRATGRYDVKSPNCRIYKAIYPALLRLEAMRLLRLAKLDLNCN